jgi:hypothetical protein
MFGFGEGNEDEGKWYDNIFIIDLLIFIFSFAFLAIAGIIMYFCYPPVMLAFQTS